MKSLMLVLMIALLGVSCSKVPSGYVGIKVHLLGGEKGVDSEELGVGKYWIGMNEELHLFPTFQQNYVWTADDREGSENNESFTFQTMEGMNVGADIGISYELDPTKVNTIFVKYRKGINEITDVVLRNTVRDAFNSVVSTMPVQSVYGAGKADMIKKVQELVMKEVGPIGININKIYLVGTLRLPPSVVKSLNAKIEATQKAQQRENEIQQTIAEANKKREEAKGHADAILSVATAKAKANSLLSRSLTPELIQYRRIEKWNGELSKVSGGSALVNMKGL